VLIIFISAVSIYSNFNRKNEGPFIEKTIQKYGEKPESQTKLIELLELQLKSQIESLELLKKQEELLEQENNYDNESEKIKKYLISNAELKKKQENGIELLNELKEILKEQENNIKYYEYFNSNTIDYKYCGFWQKQYNEFYKEMENSPHKKYLIIKAVNNTGWADKLTRIITGFYVALLSGRLFKITGINLEEIFEKPNINWNITDKEIEKLKKKSYKELDYNKMDAYQLFTNEFKYKEVEELYDEGFLYTNFTSNYENIDTLMYSIQNGKILRMSENLFHKQQIYDMGIRPDTAFGCAYEYLFKPKPNIINMVKNIYDKMGIKRNYYIGHNNKIPKDLIRNNEVEPIRIGIQVRTGDNTFKGNSNICNKDSLSLPKIAQYFECAEELEKDIFERSSNIKHKNFSLSKEDESLKKRPVYWYLLTDCKILRDLAKKKWPNKVFTITDQNIDHVELTHDENTYNFAFAEHWFFGEMDYHIITKNSSYGRTASLRRKLFNHIFDIEITQEKTKRCGLMSYNSYDDTANNWIEL
jgi:hypothetical protein